MTEQQQESFEQFFNRMHAESPETLLRAVRGLVEKNDDLRNRLRKLQKAANRVCAEFARIEESEQEPERPWKKLDSALLRLAKAVMENADRWKEPA